MKIVTYNVNGLKQRILQYGSLLKLLSSFDADIICFQVRQSVAVLSVFLCLVILHACFGYCVYPQQETKLSREELTADLVMADGYESFFSCTRTFDRGRRGYSGEVLFTNFLLYHCIVDFFLLLHFFFCFCFLAFCFLFFCVVVSFFLKLIFKFIFMFIF